MDRFLTEMNAGNYASAAECLDVSEAGEALTASQREDLAWRLKEALDRLALIDLAEINSDPAAGPYVLQPDAELPAVTIARGDDGAWLFSPETVASIDALYEKVKNRAPLAGGDWLRDLFPASLTATDFLLPTYQWICLAIVIFAGFVVDVIVRFLLTRMTATWMKLAKLEVDRRQQLALWKPLGLLARALTWYAGTVLIRLPPQVLAVLLVAVKAFATIAAVWTAFRLIDLLAGYMLKRAAGTKTKFDDLFIPLVSRSLKVFAVCVGLITLAQSLSLPIAGLLGGLGLGGAALAFASKDSLSNVFGSLTVLVDRPFEIGDWIVTADVEGTVEEVGIRSTRVRTFYNSMISVPNSLLITAVVDNMGRRRYRRIKTMLGLQYDTPPERIEAFCEGVRELIRRHPYTRKDYYHVYLNQLSESSLDVLLYCFIECPDWAVELRERQRLFIDILRLAANLQVSMAFPSRTLYMQQQDPPPPPDAIGEPLLTGRQVAAEVAGRPRSEKERPGGVQYLEPYDDATNEDSGDGPE